MALANDTPSGKALAAGHVTPQGLNAAIENIRKGRKAESASAEAVSEGAPSRLPRRPGTGFRTCRRRA